MPQGNDNPSGDSSDPTATPPTQDGGQGDGNANGNPAGDGAKPPPAAPVSQDDWNRKVSAERAQARREAERKIAEELGMSTEDAKKLIESQRAAEDAKKSEAQRLKDEADRAKADAERIKAEAAADRRAAKIERALGKAGVASDDLDVVSRMVVVDDDADDDAINSAVDELKKRPTLASLFKQEGDGGNPDTGGTGGGAPSSNPAGAPGKPSQLDDAFARGMAAGRAKVARPPAVPGQQPGAAQPPVGANQ